MRLPKINLPEVKLSWRIVGIIAAIVFIAAALLYWQLWKPRPAPPEKAKPAINQKDGSVVLARQPAAMATPKHIIPPGSVVERQVSVTVQPRATFQNVTGHRFPDASKTNSNQIPDAGKKVEAASHPCPPVTVDLSLVRNKDDTRRVIASSPDGEVVGGLDIPIEGAKALPPEKLWAVGAVMDPFKMIYGAFVDRDLGPFRTGIQINQSREDSLRDPHFWIKAGLRF